LLLKVVHVQYFQSVLPLFSLPYMPPEMPNFARQFSGHVHDQQALSALRNCSQTFPSQGCSCVIQTIATTKQVHCLFHSALGGLPLNKGGIRSRKYSSMVIIDVYYMILTSQLWLLLVWFVVLCWTPPSYTRPTQKGMTFVAWSQDKICPLPALCLLNNHLKYLVRQGFTGLQNVCTHIWYYYKLSQDLIEYPFNPDNWYVQKGLNLLHLSCVKCKAHVLSVTW